MLRFDRFTLDPVNLSLQDDSGPIRLNHKAFEVLRVLVERRGRLVSKEQLLDEVWADTHVSDGVLKVAMTEIRSALGDSASTPRFIETVHRRGYRFIAEVTADDSGAPYAQAAHAALATAGATPPSRVLVGRDRELALLEQSLARALRGERQIVVVTGEAGAGKTALVEHFVANASKHEALAITSGQSLEQYGAAEPYMPVLEAAGRLVRQSGRARALLRRYAPTWLAQLPWMMEGDERDKLARELSGSSRERMLREMGEFAEAMTAEQPVVCIAEDLHWCDPSTVDLLRLVAMRREPARLLVIVTVRPVELILARHPLRTVLRELFASRHASEIALDHLDADAIGLYLDRHFGHGRFPSGLARRLHDRTDGNPLFLVTLLDDLIARGAIAVRDGEWRMTKDLRDELAGVPDTLRLLIEQRLGRLDDDDRKLLEAASLTGCEFSAAAAAAGAGRPVGDADERLARLAEAGSFVRAVGTAAWPDGTVAGRYAFRHALYRDVLDRSAPARRRAEGHLRIAKALENAHRDRAGELAVALAVHFEEGGDRAAAIRYRRIAAESAARRHALVEAESDLEHALVLLAEMPPSAQRDAEELLLQSGLGAVRMATRGYAAPEVVAAYTRALALSSAAPEEPSAFPVLWGLWSFYAVRGELHRALELAQRTHAVAQSSGDRSMQLVGHLALWATHFFRGDFAAALEHLDAGEPADDIAANENSIMAYGQDEKVVALAQRSVLLWHLGRIDRALEVSRRSVERARVLGHPMSVAFAMSYAVWVRIIRREPQACLEEADAVIEYATEQGLPHWIPGALHGRGWALAAQGNLDEGIAAMEQGLSLLTQLGENLGRGPRMLDLARAYTRVGKFAEARALIDEANALLDVTGERYHEPDLYLVEADWVLAETKAAGRPAAAPRRRAEEFVEAALECARRRGSRTYELRALTELARLCRRGAKAEQVRAQLGNCVAAFTEGLDTADLSEARAILES